MKREVIPMDVVRYLEKKAKFHRRITERDMHLLLFFAQGFCLGITGKPLFRERITWNPHHFMFPVLIQSLSKEWVHPKWKEREKHRNVPEDLFSKEEQHVLDTVWVVYKENHTSFLTSLKNSTLFNETVDSEEKMVSLTKLRSYFQTHWVKPEYVAKENEDLTELERAQQLYDNPLARPKTKAELKQEKREKRQAFFGIMGVWLSVLFPVVFAGVMLYGIYHAISDHMSSQTGVSEVHKPVIEIFTGYVTGKEHIPGKIETDYIMVPAGSSFIQVPVDHSLPDEYLLHVAKGPEVKTVKVTRGLFTQVKEAEQVSITFQDGYVQSVKKP
ncbi:hypothetical protein ACFYKX_11015 [Cytobacillus sp. FJAT-54145]|uniref:Uncharacterized protein n=1 Tax=Cytobacillus spartinae TaxID=3299023 RepID=A0ABW6KBL5_9BACI